MLPLVLNVILPAIRVDCVMLHLQGISVCVMWVSRGMESLALTSMSVRRMFAPGKRLNV